MKFSPAAQALTDILFIDVVTVSQYPNFVDAPEPYQRFWERKAARFMDAEETPESIYSKSAIFSEFGRILAISMGFFHNPKEGDETLRITTLIGDERALLREFARRVERFAAKHENINFCAHNGKEFDFPYIARRCLIQGLSIPRSLYVAGRKPWETHFLDTFELWKFGDYKHYTSLYLLGYIFGVSELMEDMEGSQVHDAYYQAGDLAKIAEFSQRKLATCAQLYRRFVGLPALPRESLNYNEFTPCEPRDDVDEVLTEPVASSSTASVEPSSIPSVEISSETPLFIPLSASEEIPSAASVATPASFAPNSPSEPEITPFTQEGVEG